MLFLRRFLYIMAFLLLPCSTYADWQPYQNIVPSFSTALIPPPIDEDIGIDQQGNAVGIVQRINDILASTRPFNGNWTAPVPLSAAGSTPRIAVDPNGNAVAIWVEAGNIRASTYTLISNSWSPSILIDTGTSSRPEIAIAPTGRIFAIWQKQTGPNNVIRYISTTSLPGTPADLSPVSSAPFDSLDIAAGGNGALAGWKSSIAGVVTRNIPVFGVLPPVVAHMPSNAGSQFSLDLNPAGDGIVIWTSANIVYSDVYTEGVWSIMGAIPGAINAQFPDVAIDDTGNAVALWAQTVAVQEIHGAYLPFNSMTWQDTSVLNAPAAFNGRDPVVDFDGVGNAVAVWDQFISGVASITQAVTLPFGTLNWGPAITVSPNPGVGGLDNTSTRIAVNQAGNALSGWLFITPPMPLTIDPQTSANSIPSIVTSSVVASPIGVIADGVDSSIVTVTVLDGNGRPIVGNSIELTQNGSATITPAFPQITDAQGKVVFTVKDATPETVTFTATDLQTTIVIGTVDVNFIVPADPLLSTATAFPLVVEANGVDSSTVTVTLRDSGGNLLPNRNVRLTQTGSSSITPPGALIGIGVTNGSGVVEFIVTNTTPEAVTYTATDNTAPNNLVVVTQKPVVTFLESITDPLKSRVLAKPTSVFADGVSFSTITVYLRDSNNYPVVGHDVILVDNGGSSIISSPSGPSNAAGIVTFTVTDTVVESVTYTAIDLTSGDIEIDQTATVNFTPPPPLPPSNFEGIRVVNKFASQKEFTDILTWTPSPDPVVVSYRLYVNDVLERTIPAQGPYRVEFKHRCDNLIYVYRLVALSNQGVESSPLFVTLPH